ncbi:MAG: hypothetical protein WAS51_02295 [Ilumatobacteraceae bacterium]
MSAAIGSILGLLATNSISQGDTRDVGLSRLIEDGWSIYRAVRSEPWPNEAALEIAKVWMSREPWDGKTYLDGSDVGGVTSALGVARGVQGEPFRLATYRSDSFQGTKVTGMGFVLALAEAERLVAADARNRDVIFGYLSGKDANDSPDGSPSRAVINFFGWSETEASEYALPFRHLELNVKPERTRLKPDGRYQLREPLPTKWWVYGDRRTALYERIRDADRVLVVVLHSPHAIPVFVGNGLVYSHALAVFSYADDAHLALLTSSFHWWWVVEHGSTLGGEANIRYTPTDVFDTFPQPVPQLGAAWTRVDVAGRELDKFRSDLMNRTGLGLTKTYNRFHDPSEQESDVIRLRELHVELDHAVRDAYGWPNLELGHHHWETAQGMRFTVSPAARDELLDRLLELNLQRYAEEVAAGLHDKKSKKAPAKRAKAVDENQESML